jgi:hypothetical protein
MPVANLMDVALHATPKLVNIRMEAFPCCLSAYADRPADYLPRCATGNGLADELGLPG